MTVNTSTIVILFKMTELYFLVNLENQPTGRLYESKVLAQLRCNELNGFLVDEENKFKVKKFNASDGISKLMEINHESITEVE